MLAMSTTDMQVSPGTGMEAMWSLQEEPYRRNVAPTPSAS